MNQQSRSLRLLLLLLLLLSLIAVPAVMAQEEAAAEPETAAATETAPAEEAVNPLVPLGINAGFLVAQIFNFLFLFIVLSIVLWRPLMNMLDSRAAKIQKGLEDAAAAANARRDAEAEAERIKAAARADVARMIEEARQRGEDLAKQIENEAQAEAEKIRAEARARANEERDRQLADLRGQVAAIAIAVSHRLIGESLDEKRQQALINDFFSKVPAEAKSLNGPVEVISAMPLDEAEQARIKQEIGVDQVTFSVDPSILGGLVIRTTDRVVDGSVRSGLTELAGLLR